MEEHSEKKVESLKTRKVIPLGDEDKKERKQPEVIQKPTIRIKQPRVLDLRSTKGVWKEFKPSAVQTIDTDYINNKRGGDWDKFGNFKQIMSKESSSVRIENNSPHNSKSSKVSSPKLKQLKKLN